MKFFSFFIGLFFITISQSSYSQVIIKTSTPDTISHWEKKDQIGLDLSEIAFVNWSVGGNSSVSGLLKGKFSRKYERENVTWYNELLFRYGINKQEGRELRKTDDAIQINSTFGYRNDTISKWYHSAKFNFNTQFTNGYSYPNTDIAISKPFSPAYVFLGVGAEYIDKENKLNFYLSPLTQKTTLVFDERLADQGAFGVNKAIYDADGNMIRPGKRSRTEVGILLTNHWKTEVYKNINFENRLSLYSDYINRFGNIDVDWQAQLDFVVNEYVRANIGVHMIYDDDIKAKEEIDGKQVTVGPKLQLKQTLGIGLLYAF
ncbi:DUF3078 domain-containing protein [Flavobacterium sp. '19STA2R22 D10 B1']|uniref:DUF3078 domain-containing protein n=1 Tax=Flavobacterium aerium TaxID=3037261 RepID=UPI00278C8137|nr:DUF3078 domain-containing protein [Flavobacterium sp. '19STA2R22 D10 B1']